MWAWFRQGANTIFTGPRGALPSPQPLSLRGRGALKTSRCPLGRLALVRRVAQAQGLHQIDNWWCMMAPLGLCHPPGGGLADVGRLGRWLLLIAMMVGPFGSCLAQEASLEGHNGTGAPRLALVIGNADYESLRPLANPRNDAAAMAARLSRLGFQLIGPDGKPAEGAVRDLDEDRFHLAIKRFAATAKRVRAEIALFYYAGHGMQFGRHAYLLPVDVPSEDIELVQRHALALEGVLKRLDGRAALTVAIFDACREIPELENAIATATRDAGFRAADFRGLARVQGQGRSRIVAYSAAAGELAADGDGRHSPYTELLLDALDAPEQEIGDLFRAVAWRFGQVHDSQQPELLIQGVPPDRFYFALVPKPSPDLPEMVEIPAGCFQMGSPGGEAGHDMDERQHQVCLEGFRLAKYEVTVGDFQRFVAATQYQTDAERDAGGEPGCWAYEQDSESGSWAYRAGSSWRRPSRHQEKRADHPVACLSWHDVQVYLAWLNHETGEDYRLPTEAEWEYAARAGTRAARYWGDAPDVACRYANVADLTRLPADGNWTHRHACTDGHAFASPVGRFEPNPWGLHDMLGNVWEWTCSLYDQDYLGEERLCASADRDGARVMRGGSWGNDARWVRSAARFWDSPKSRGSYLGLRLALDK